MTVTDPPPTPLTTTVALMLGGTVAVLVTGFGAWSMAAGSYPYAFGMDVNGDRSYPFPFPEAVLVGGVVVVIGLGLGGALVAAARGYREGRVAGLVLLGLVAVVVGLLAGSASHGRRCPVDAYTQREHCASASTAAVRDVVLFDTVPLLAGVALALTPTDRRRARPLPLPPQPI